MKRLLKPRFSKECGVLYFNHPIQMRGYTAEEAVAQTFEQAMTPESLQISARVFEEEMKLEAGGTADPDRIRIVDVEQYRKDGSIILNVKGCGIALAPGTNCLPAP